MEAEFSDTGDQKGEESGSSRLRCCCLASSSLSASSVLARGSERAFSQANAELENASCLKLKIHGTLLHRVCFMNMELDTILEDCGQFLSFIV